MKNWINLIGLIVAAFIVLFAIKFDSWWGMVVGAVIAIFALLSNASNRN